MITPFQATSIPTENLTHVSHLLERPVTVHTLSFPLSTPTFSKTSPIPHLLYWSHPGRVRAPLLNNTATMMLCLILSRSLWTAHHFPVHTFFHNPPERVKTIFPRTTEGRRKLQPCFPLNSIQFLDAHALSRIRLSPFR